MKTTAQKIIYKVITECNLNIPVGWYINVMGICTGAAVPTISTPTVDMYGRVFIIAPGTATVPVGGANSATLDILSDGSVYVAIRNAGTPFVEWG